MSDNVPALSSAIAAAKQMKYAEYRRIYAQQWEISDEEDWCARKEVTPGTYKPIGWL